MKPKILREDLSKLKDHVERDVGIRRSVEDRFATTEQHATIQALRNEVESWKSGAESISETAVKFQRKCW